MDITGLIKILSQGKRKACVFIRKHNAKFHALGRTLDLLTTLDEDHFNYIVNTHLAHTEFTNLIDDKKILAVFDMSSTAPDLRFNTVVETNGLQLIAEARSRKKRK